MDGTRARIIELLQQSDGVTVEALTGELDLAAATVRRHLDVLQRDGYVERRAVRRGTGRPHYAFSVTQAGRDLTPGHYAGVMELLVAEMIALTEADTKDKDGNAVALLVFERMNAALLRSCERRVTAPRLQDRLQQAVEALADGGLMLETAPQRDGYLITVRDCPCRCAGSAQDAVCQRAEVMLERLLRAPLQREESSQAEVCRYVVSA
jgi:predicted ArsR family transcriptional regulator